MIEGFKRLVKYLRARDKESMNSKGEGGRFPHQVSRRELDCEKLGYVLEIN